MARYFINVYDDLIARDKEGLELANIGQVERVARAAARELAANEVKRGTLHPGHRIEVADENGSVVATVKFRDLVSFEG